MIKWFTGESIPAFASVWKRHCHPVPPCSPEESLCLPKWVLQSTTGQGAWTSSESEWAQQKYCLLLIHIVQTDSTSGEDSCKTKSMNAWISPHQIYYSTWQHFCLLLKIKMFVDHHTVLYWPLPWLISAGASQLFFQPIFISCPGASASPLTTQCWIWKSISLPWKNLQHSQTRRPTDDPIGA